MNLEVGMYVRTLNGIVKIEKILDGVMWDTQGHLHFGDFIKASHNIIDLIEVGDYVNGYLVTFVYRPDGNEVFRIEIERDTLQGHIMSNNQIKSIVTKEQFESMSYKVGE